MARIYICNNDNEEYEVSEDLVDILLYCHKCKTPLEPKFNAIPTIYKGNGFTGARKGK